MCLIICMEFVLRYFMMVDFFISTLGCWITTLEMQLGWRLVLVFDDAFRKIYSKNIVMNKTKIIITQLCWMRHLPQFNIGCCSVKWLSAQQVL